MFLADVHIYENHVDQVREQLSREPYPLPTLKLHLHPAPEGCPLEYLISTLVPSTCELRGYQHHPAISAPMAV
jgi:thymidylate synthase